MCEPARRAIPKTNITAIAMALRIEIVVVAAFKGLTDARIQMTNDEKSALAYATFAKPPERHRGDFVPDQLSARSGRAYWHRISSSKPRG